MRQFAIAKLGNRPATTLQPFLNRPAVNCGMAVSSEIGANSTWTPGCGPDRTGRGVRGNFRGVCEIGEIHTEFQKADTVD